MISISSALYISGQLSRLNKATSADDQPDPMTRYIGGSERNTQPHISGYHHVMIFFPETLFGIWGDYGDNSAQNWLMATCEGFTPHSSNVNMADVSGLGQTGVSFPISRTINREFTLTFREYQNLPILTTIRSWHSLYEPHIGTMTLPLPPLAYKGIVVIAIVKPTYRSNGEFTTDDLEEGYIYSGVYPINCPDEVTSSDQTTNESVLASVNFRFDGAPLDIGMLGVAEAIVACFSDYNYLNFYNNNTFGV